MSVGEMYFWAIISAVGLAIIIGCIAAYRESLRPPGGARFVSEEEVRRIENQGRRAP